MVLISAVLTLERISRRAVIVVDEPTLSAPLARVLRGSRRHEQPFRLGLVLDELVESVKRPFGVPRCFGQPLTDAV